MFVEPFIMGSVSSSVQTCTVCYVASLHSGLYGFAEVPDERGQWKAQPQIRIVNEYGLKAANEEVKHCMKFDNTNRNESITKQNGSITSYTPDQWAQTGKCAAENGSTMQGC